MCDAALVNGKCHLCEVHAADLAREKVSYKSGQNQECFFTRKSTVEGRVSGECEDGDGVHQHPQAAGVTTVMGKTAVTVFPSGFLWKQLFVKLE